MLLPSAKAVAEGALAWYVDGLVSARVAKYMFGSKCARPFLPFLADHKARAQTVRPNMGGTLCVPGAFSNTLPKVSDDRSQRVVFHTVLQGTLVSEEKEFSSSFNIGDTIPRKSITCDITCYKGEKVDIEWIDEDPGKQTVFLEIFYINVKM